MISMTIPLSNMLIFPHRVRIICPIHGEFWQRPSDHLDCKEACYRCRGVVKTTEEFIEEARNIHGDRYDYSQADFKSMIDEITIICPKHGPFSQIVRLHLKGCGCPRCIAGEEPQLNSLRRQKRSTATDLIIRKPTTLILRLR